MINSTLIGDCGGGGGGRTSPKRKQEMIYKKTRKEIFFYLRIISGPGGGGVGGCKYLTAIFCLYVTKLFGNVLRTKIGGGC